MRLRIIFRRTRDPYLLKRLPKKAQAVNDGKTCAYKCQQIPVNLVK